MHSCGWGAKRLEAGEVLAEQPITLFTGGAAPAATPRTGTTEAPTSNDTSPMRRARLRLPRPIMSPDHLTRGRRRTIACSASGAATGFGGFGTDGSQGAVHPPGMVAQAATGLPTGVSSVTIETPVLPGE